MNTSISFAKLRKPVKTLGWFCFGILSLSMICLTDTKAAQLQSGSGSLGTTNWEFNDETGTLIISGEGELKKKFNEYENIKHVVIESGITKIGESSFKLCTGLIDVTIPGSVSDIGEYAFYGCTSLGSMVIPDGVTSIQWYAFCNCNNLKRLSISKSVTEFSGINTFVGCNNLESIKVDAENEVFSDGNGSNVIIKHSSYDNNQELILGCKNSVIPNGCTLIGHGAFSGRVGLKKITIPGTVKTIYSAAFAGCSSLESVQIENGVLEIQEYAFSRCSSLKSIKIPDSVTTMSYRVFEECDSLSSVELPKDIQEIPNTTFYNCKGLLSITIPKNVERIGSSAFTGCSALTSIVIPASVREIDGSAFDGCSSLERIIVDEKNSDYNDGNGSDVIIGSLVVDGERKVCVLAGCKNSVIPEGVERINDYAFKGAYGLKGMYIPEGIEVIDEYAFADCKDLENVSIPSTVSYMGTGAFDGCEKLNSVTLLSTKWYYLEYADVPYSATIYCYEEAANYLTSIGYTCVLLEAHPHKLKEVEAKEANCGVPGNRKYYVCEQCDKFYYDEKGLSIMPESVAIIPATGKHTFVNGKCTVCGQLQNASGMTEPGKTEGRNETSSDKKTGSEKILAPAKAKILSAKNSKKQTAIVKWKEVSSASGYEVQYALDKKFKKSCKTKKTSKTKLVVKKLKKGKKYFVRVRAYKNGSDGKPVYGDWSKIKKVKVKK